MKNIFFLVIGLFISVLANGQSSIDTATVNVSGLCGMCQERIENAAYIKGVKRASWDKGTKVLTVIYDTKKVSLMQIEQSVAKAGHDTEHVKATDAAYAKIHGCCKYRTDDTH